MKKRTVVGGMLTVVVLAVVLFCTLKPRVDSNRDLPISGEAVSETGAKIRVMVADTPRRRELGLSFFDSLPPGQGMAFLFDRPGKNGFWMKDMSFPIDIVWLSRLDGPAAKARYRIIHTEEAVSPDSYPASFGPDDDSDLVLEIGAHQAKPFGISEGKTLVLTK